MNYLKIIRDMTFSLLFVCALALATALVAEAQEASTSYKGAGRDPFVKYRPPVKLKSNKKVEQVGAPTIQERIAQYKRQKAAAMAEQRPAPKPTTALLLSEVQVTGIFRTPRGYAAMVEATPIKLSYVIYPGEAFFDGLLVAIEENRLVFRRETRWSDGRRETGVETKPLRPSNAVDDSMTSSTSAAANHAPAAAAGNQ